MTKTKINTRDMVYIAACAALLAICSWISIPVDPPYTLQTMGVFLTIGLLGGKRGTVAVLLYILLGAIGMPVFAGFAGGIGVLLGTTGGYIVGFLASVLVMWGMERFFGRSTAVLLLSMVLGLLACYAFGTAWYMVVYARTAGAIGVAVALGRCVIPFVIPDLLKIAAAMVVVSRVEKHVG